MNGQREAARLLAIVARNHHVAVSDLQGRRRGAKVVLARQRAMYFIRQYTNLTLAETGQMLGGRSPATVTYGYQKIAKLGAKYFLPFEKLK